MSDVDVHSALLNLRGHAVALLAALDQLVEAVAPVAPEPHVDLVALDRTKAIEQVLLDRAGPMTPVQIWAELEQLRPGRDPKMEVQVTTYDLWRRGRIAKLDRGVYCHLLFIPPGSTNMKWSA